MMKSLQLTQLISCLLVALICALLATPADATIVTLRDGLNGYSGTEDTYLEKNQSGTAAGEEDFNYGGSSTLEIFNRSVRDTLPLVQFDLSSLAGNIVSINSATIILTTATDNFSAASSVEVFRIAHADRDWVEGTATGAVQTGSSTWDDKLNPSTAWSVGSEDARFGYVGHFVTALGSSPMATAGGANTFSLSGDLSFLIDWADNPSDNAGFLFAKVSGDQFLPGNTYHSSEALTGAFRPTLILDIEQPVPEPSSLILLGLGALGLMRHTRRRRRRA